MKFEVGPTGNLIEGDILDVSKDHLTAALKAYDTLLYIKWNPKKIHGRGCWELRRRPEFKTVVLREIFEGNTYSIIDYKELDVENHVLDMPYLNYEVLTRIKKMDLWANSGYDRSNKAKLNNFWDKMDGIREDVQTADQKKAYDDLLYNTMQQKSALRSFKDAILSGVNPADIAKYWK